MRVLELRGQFAQGDLGAEYLAHRVFGLFPAQAKGLEQVIADLSLRPSADASIAQQADCKRAAYLALPRAMIGTAT